jgi:GT2 family glycosyltransferase
MDSEEKYITVIIPTYMRPEILEETVPSYFQEYVKEVILVADGGQDLGKLSMVVQKLYNLAKMKEIKFSTFFLKHRVGSIRIINFVVNKINTEFFLIGEDDVLLYPNCIKTLLEKYFALSKKEKIGGVVPKLIRHDNYIPFQGKYKYIYSYISPFTGEVYFNYQLETKKETKVLVTHKVLLTKKSIFKEVGGYNEKFSVGIYWRSEWRAENELNLRYYKKGYSIYYVPSAIAEHKSYKRGGWRLLNYNWGKMKFYTYYKQCIFLKTYRGLGFIFPISIYILKDFLNSIRFYANNKFK